MISVWGLLHCGVQVCSDEKRLVVVTKWGESVFRSQVFGGCYIVGCK